MRNYERNGAMQHSEIIERNGAKRIQHSSMFWIKGSLQLTTTLPQPTTTPFYTFLSLIRIRIQGEASIEYRYNINSIDNI